MIRPTRPDQQFRSFAISFSPTLLRAAYVMLGDLGLAEDAVQITMLRTFRRWDNASEAPEAYSRRALISVCRDHWRRQRRRVKEIRLDASGAGGRTISFTEDVERRQALDQALSELPVLQREVLVARFYFDLPIESTAELLDIPEGTVKSNTHRGLERLRDLLSVPEETAGS